MCHFVSWIDLNGKTFYLNDNSFNTKDMRKIIKKYSWRYEMSIDDVINSDSFKSDLIGHGMIRSFYPELGGRGKDLECEVFVNPVYLPQEIVSDIKNGLFSQFGICPDILTTKALSNYNKQREQIQKECDKLSDDYESTYNKFEKKVQNWFNIEYNKVFKIIERLYNKIGNLRSSGDITTKEYYKYLGIIESIEHELNSLENEFCDLLNNLGFGDERILDLSEILVRKLFWKYAKVKKNRTLVWQ